MTTSVVLLVGLLVAGPTPAATATSGWVLEQLVWDDPPVGNGFASVMAFDGDHLAAAGGPFDARYVDVFVRSGDLWTREQRLTGFTRVDALAVQGDELVAASSETDGSKARLTVYSGDPLTVTSRLDMPAAVTSVDLDHDQLIVGVDQPFAGAQIYDRTTTGWALAPGGQLPQSVYAGYPRGAVEIAGDLAVVPRAARVEVFARTADGWQADSVILAPAGADSNVAPEARIVGDQVLMSASVSYYGYNDTILVEHRTDGGWTSAQTLSVPAGITDLDASSDRLVVLDHEGLLKSWRPHGATWAAEGSAHRPPDGGFQDRDGFRAPGSVRLAGDRVALGRPGADALGVRGAGQVVVMRFGGAPAQPPAAPTHVDVSDRTSSGGATVRWRAPTGTPVLKYVVRRQTGSYEAEPVTAYLAPDRRSLVVTGLKKGEDYRFSVRAVGPGGLGAVAWTDTLWAGNPRTVSSPYTVHDPAGDQADPKQDIRTVTTDASGSAITVRLRMQQPSNPYTDPVWRGFGGMRFRVLFKSPSLNQAMINNVDTPGQTSGTIPGEDVTMWFLRTRPCLPGVFPARYVDGNLQATVRSGCVQLARSFEVAARSTGDDRKDYTDYSPPIERARSTGGLWAGRVKVTSVKVDSTGRETFTVSYEASERSGIRRATTRVFSDASGQQPVRLGHQSCTRVTSWRSRCTARFTVQAGELRDQDAGRWRVFAEIHAKKHAVLVKERLGSFSVRRATHLVEVTGTRQDGRLTVTGQLLGATWNTGEDKTLDQRDVVLQRRSPGSSRWSDVATARTDATGRLTLSTTARSGSWRLVFAQTTTYAGATQSLRS